MLEIFFVPLKGIELGIWFARHDPLAGIGFIMAAVVLVRITRIDVPSPAGREEP